MRQIGKIERPERAVRFVDYLLTQGISAKTEEFKDQWIIWIHDENQIDQAKSELDAFRLDPDHSRYTEAKHEATAIRKVEHKESEQRRKNIINMRGKFKNPGMGRMSGPAPVTKTLMIISIAVTALGMFMSSPRGQPDGLGDWAYAYCYFVMPYKTEFKAVAENKDPLISIKKGQVWRLVTPIFPHSRQGIMHILFGMYMLFSLGGRLESYLGAGKFLLLCLLFAVGSNLAEAYGGVFIDGAYHPFGGMSGVLYGIFGFMWMKTRYDPDPRTYLPPSTIFILLIWFVLCWMEVIPNIANYAHGGGLLLGVITGAWGKLMQK